MDMSMDKPIVLSSTVGIRGPQVKNAKIEVPTPWEFEKHGFRPILGAQKGPKKIHTF